MSFVFVQASHDYADEFDVEGCFVMPKPHFEKQLADIKAAFDEGKITDSTELYFGTNEALRFDTFRDFERGLEIKECSEQFYDEFKALTGGSGHIGHDTMGSLLDHASGAYD